MIDKALLDAIAELPTDDAAQAHAKAWALRVRDLRQRQGELRHAALASFDAGDHSGCEAAVSEHGRVSAELLRLCHKQMEMQSRLRPSTGTMQ